MRSALITAMVCATLLTALYLWLTPYRYTKVGPLPVRVHRLTSRTEILQEIGDQRFAWRPAGGR